MDSISLPMVPDLEAFPKPVRYGLLAVLVLGPLLFGLLVVLGGVSSPTVVVDATAVDSPPSDAEVYRLSGFAEGSPIRAATEEALRDGSGSVETTVADVRSGTYPGTEFYVRDDGRFVRVTIDQ
jgi:hypothetical protein